PLSLHDALPISPLCGDPMRWRSSIRIWSKDQMTNTIMPLLRTRLHTLAMLAAVVTLTGMVGTNARAGQASQAPRTVAIEIDNFKFGIASLEVAVGTTVT